MFCPNCGKEIKEGSRFCEMCGSKLIMPGEASEEAGTLLNNAGITEENLPHGPEAGVTLCGDGVYRWAYEVNLFKNPSFLITIMKVMIIADVATFFIILLSYPIFALDIDDLFYIDFAPNKLWWRDYWDLMKGDFVLLWAVLPILLVLVWRMAQRDEPLSLKSA